MAISLLIGAGFSAPMGNPIGNKLNDCIATCKGDEFAFHTDGTLMISSDGLKPDIGYKTSYDLQFEFCKKYIEFYCNDKRGFDYELFYDFMKEEASGHSIVNEIAKPFLKGYSSVEDLLNKHDNIYAQLIDYYLKDGDGNRWYHNASHACRPIFPGYTGILNCLHNFMNEHILHVHSLNHDLFFERLNWSDWIQGEICDGFEEIGSSYYGELQSYGGRYKVRLEKYTGIYDKKICLYKLHGSRDYGVYYSMNSNGIAQPENYVKTKFGVRFGDMFKEKVNEVGQLEYEHCFINYHADFLTGTTSKIERYKEPLLYKKLFETFRINLRNSEKLIIIGYGAKDSEINNMILENFNYHEKPVLIIDPYPSTKVDELKNILNAELITKHLEDMNIEDLNLNH